MTPPSSFFLDTMATFRRRSDEVLIGLLTERPSPDAIDAALSSFAEEFASARTRDADVKSLVESAIVRLAFAAKVDHCDPPIVADAYARATAAGFEDIDGDVTVRLIYVRYLVEHDMAAEAERVLDRLCGDIMIEAPGFRKDWSALATIRHRYAQIGRAAPMRIGPLSDDD